MLGAAYDCRLVVAWDMPGMCVCGGGVVLQPAHQHTQNTQTHTHTQDTHAYYTHNTNTPQVAVMDTLWGTTVYAATGAVLEWLRGTPWFGRLRGE